MVDLELLERVVLFSGLDRDQLARIQPHCDLLALDEGHKIISGGEKAVYLYFVLEGKVDLRFDLPLRSSSEETTISTIRPGSSFGWASLVEPHIYHLSAYSTTDNCRVGRVKGSDLLAIFNKDKALGYEVMSHLCRLIAKRFSVMQDEVVKREGFDIMMAW